MPARRATPASADARRAVDAALGQVEEAGTAGAVIFVDPAHG